MVPVESMGSAPFPSISSSRSLHLQQLYPTIKNLNIHLTLRTMISSTASQHLKKDFVVCSLSFWVWIHWKLQWRRPLLCGLLFQTLKIGIMAILDFFWAISDHIYTNRWSMGGYALLHLCPDWLWLPEVHAVAATYQSYGSNALMHNTLYGVWPWFTKSTLFCDEEHLELEIETINSFRKCLLGL